MDLNFEKIDNRWYADMPDYPGDFEDLEMVDGSDKLLDLITSDNKFASLDVYTDEPPTGDHYTARLVYHDAMGGTYKGDFDFFQGTFWLCNVTHFLFKEHPEVIYIKIVE